MRYQKRNEEEILFNGHSEVRVRTVGHITRPKSPGRVIKVMEVRGVSKSSPSNPILPGALLAVSFPETSVNSKSYTWREKDPHEECQVKFKGRLHKVKGLMVDEPPQPQPDEPATGPGGAPIIQLGNQ